MNIASGQTMSGATQLNNFSVYENKTLGIAMSYPSGWQGPEQANDSLTLYPPSQSGLDSLNVWVDRSNISSSVFLDSDLVGYINDTKYNVKDFKLIAANTSTTLAGQPAYIADFNAKYPETSPDLFRDLEIGTSVGVTNILHVHYSATIQDYYRYLPEVLKVINSVQILPSLRQIHADNSHGYIKVDNDPLDTWFKDPLNVYIDVDPTKSKQPLKYVNDAVNAIEKWSMLLKKYSGNDNAWNFNIHTVNQPIELSENSSSHIYNITTKFNPPADIVLELREDLRATECSQNATGLSYGLPVDPYGAEYSYVYTSCGKPFYYERDHRSVQTTVMHEFEHDLGIGHSYNFTGSLMCGIDEIKKNSTACPFGLEPTDLDINALPYKYRKDGFKPPNPELKNDTYRVGMQVPDYTSSGVSMSLPGLTKNNINDYDNSRNNIYENYTNGIKVQYPYNWYVVGTNESRPSRTFAYFNPFGNHGINYNATLSMSIDEQYLKQNPGLKLEDVMNADIDGFKKDKENYPDFKLIESDDNYKINGAIKAYKIIGTYKDNIFGATTQLMRIGIINGHRLYNLDYISADPQHRNFDVEAERIIQTFQIT
jgi:hypothetical protein